MSGPPEHRRGGVLLALGAALAFSTLGIWGKLAQRLELPTFTLLPWRFAIAAAVLFAVTARGARLAHGERLRLLLNGVLYTLATGCYFLALERISAGATSLLLYLAPAFVVLYQWLLGTRPHAAQVGAVGLSAIGLGLVIGLPGAADRDVRGIGLGILSGALYGAYLLYNERAVRTPPLVATAYLSLGSAVGFGAIGAATGTLKTPVGADSWGVIAGMTVVATLVAVPMLFAAVRRIGAARTSVIATTEPLWTVLLAFAILGEPLRGAVLGGAAFILAGAALAQQEARTVPGGVSITPKRPPTNATRSAGRSDSSEPAP